MGIKLYNKLPSHFKKSSEHTTFQKQTKVFVIATDLFCR
jgi:hypothetical protein